LGKHPFDVNLENYLVTSKQVIRKHGWVQIGGCDSAQQSLVKLGSNRETQLVARICNYRSRVFEQIRTDGTDGMKYEYWPPTFEVLLTPDHTYI